LVILKYKSVISGSACVYVNNKEICVEEDSWVPNNPYGQTKAMIET
jgi:UDP-glucose 4-epimerase